MATNIERKPKSRAYPEDDEQGDVKDDGSDNERDQHSQTVAEGRPKRKRHQDRFKRALPSYALDNARERLDAFYLKHKEVLDEYFTLREEVKGVAISLTVLERSLKGLCRDLSNYYEERRDS